MTNPPPPVKQITTTVPVELRQRNWASRRGWGSCWWASTICMLNWQGHYVAAGKIRLTMAGAADVYDVARKFRELGVEYEMVAGGGPEFLEWVSRSRRIAAIHYGYRNEIAHAVTFAGYRGDHAIIIDNRWPGKEIKIRKVDFLATWLHGGGYAITAMSPPPPPKPWR